MAAAAEMAAVAAAAAEAAAEAAARATEEANDVRRALAEAELNAQARQEAEVIAREEAEAAREAALDAKVRAAAEMDELAKLKGVAAALERAERAEALEARLQAKSVAAAEKEAARAAEAAQALALAEMEREAVKANTVLVEVPSIAFDFSTVAGAPGQTDQDVHGVGYHGAQPLAAQPARAKVRTDEMPWGAPPPPEAGPAERLWYDEAAEQIRQQQRSGSTPSVRWDDDNLRWDGQHSCSTIRMVSQVGAARPAKPAGRAPLARSLMPQATIEPVVPTAAPRVDTRRESMPPAGPKAEARRRAREEAAAARAAEAAAVATEKAAKAAQADAGAATPPPAVMPGSKAGLGASLSLVARVAEHAAHNASDFKSRQELMLDPQERLYRRNLAKVRAFHDQLRSKVAADRQMQIAKAAHGAIDAQLSESHEFDFAALKPPEARGARQPTPSGASARPSTTTAARPLASSGSAPTLRPLTQPASDATRGGEAPLSFVQRLSPPPAVELEAALTAPAPPTAAPTAAATTDELGTTKERLLSEIEQLVGMTARALNETALNEASRPVLDWEGRASPLHVPAVVEEGEEEGLDEDAETGEGAAAAAAVEAELHAQREADAATIMQKRARGHAGRSHAEVRLRVKAQGEAAATKMQSLYRGRRARADQDYARRRGEAARSAEWAVSGAKLEPSRHIRQPLGVSSGQNGSGHTPSLPGSRIRPCCSYPTRPHAHRIPLVPGPRGALCGILRHRRLARPWG